MNKLQVTLELPPSIETAEVISLAGRLCEQSAKLLANGHSPPQGLRVNRTTFAACVVDMLKAAVEHAAALCGGKLHELTFEMEEDKHPPNGPEQQHRPRDRRRVH